MSNPRTALFDSASTAAGSAGLPATSLRARIGNWLARGLPQLCALCAAPSGSELLCPPCAEGLPHAGAACPRCALATPGGVCRACREHPPPWREAQAAFAYAYPLDRLLHALKYRGALAHAPFLAHALAGRVNRAGAPRPDMLVAMPLSAARQRTRGYNQAIEIARPLGRRVGLPLVGALRRIEDTPPLASLPWRDRHRAVARAFAANDLARGRSIALVDDILTTGATLRAATRALVTAGATRVDVWVVARTLPPTS